MNERSISMEYEFSHPPAKVWRALTDPKLVARWLMATDIEAVKGKQFSFRAEPAPWWDGVVNCEVLEVEPHRRLRYTWRGGPASSRLDTIVTWTLSETASGGTRLLLEHTGFSPETTFAFDGAQKGWQRNLDERLRQALAEVE